MLIGYARVSTLDQNPDLQLDALKEAGCEKIFTEKVSATKANRPALEEALEFARAGDLLVVWQLTRLCRSAKDALVIADNLHKRGIGIRILTGRLAGNYTPTGEGKFFFTVMAAVAELEHHHHILERTQAGLAAARARGRVGGQPPKLTPKQVAQLRTLAADKDTPVKDICSTFGISRSTYYRALHGEEAAA
jgi:DNA invertase Pin-like site-specific DNA recombinase